MQRQVCAVCESCAHPPHTAPVPRYCVLQSVTRFTPLQIHSFSTLPTSSLSLLSLSHRFPSPHSTFLLAHFCNFTLFYSYILLLYSFLIRTVRVGLVRGKTTPTMPITFQDKTRSWTAAASDKRQDKINQSSQPTKQTADETDRVHSGWSIRQKTQANVQQGTT